MFRTNTLDRSRAAANREVLTTHLRESLSDGAKNLLFLSNYLGGEYHLAPDEVFIDQDRTLIIQESKNTTRSRLPSSDDIKDGLSKLILYCNLNTVSVDEVETPFRTQLKLTGFIRSALHNADVPTIRSFCATNLFSTSQTNRLIALQQEILANPRLRIYIAGNQ
ncbi:MAG: hypothetical protein KF726_20050 [Anaerolineae bacterium]|nr:hypothetical protein [Anaerolineae bacterium]